MSGILLNGFHYKNHKLEFFKESDHYYFAIDSDRSVSTFESYEECLNAGKRVIDNDRVNDTTSTIEDARSQADLLAEIARLQEQLESFKLCPTYGIYTRAGLEHEWLRIRQESEIAIAYCDIDNLKEKNTLLGHSHVDSLLADAFSVVRKSDRANESLLGRYYSGDEFVFLANKKDILIPCQRFAQALARPQETINQLTVTIAVTPYLGQKDLKDAIADAATTVAIAKKCGKKNTIINLLP